MMKNKSKDDLIKLALRQEVVLANRFAVTCGMSGGIIRLVAFEQNGSNAEMHSRAGICMSSDDAVELIKLLTEMVL